MDQEEVFEQNEIVGLQVINIEYDNDPCSMILFRNWTTNFRYQYAKSEQQLQEMITATVSHEMRTPISAMMTQVDNLSLMQNNSKQVTKMTKSIKISAQLLLYLVNDMLDVYTLKNGKFQPVEEKVKPKQMLKEIYEMFSLQMSAKGLVFKLEMCLRIPYYVTSDKRRLMQVMINLLSNALKFTNEGSITLECNFDDQKKSIMF